jgi:hypothetical protein
MHTHHAIRGGLLLAGVVIGSFVTTASAGAGSHGVVTARAADIAAVPGAGSVEVRVDAPLALAPAAVPVLIEVAPAVPSMVEAASTPVDGQEVEPGSGPSPEVPVIQAGPGPAVPVPGAVTLIDPLVIERDPADATA